MNIRDAFTRTCVALVVSAGTLNAFAQPDKGTPIAPPQPATPTPAPKLSATQLDELTGPIALYPDALVAQILPAATYGTDIVMAARMINKGATAAELDAQPWDPSVKALSHYPNIIKMMDENLDWTAQLGEAFARQPDDMMQSIQRLRVKAKTLGNLVDTPQQHVVAQDNALIIEPASPQVIYVPSYDPVVVYERPCYYDPIIGSPWITFGAGFAVGAWLNYGCNWWGGGCFSPCGWGWGWGWSGCGFRSCGWWGGGSWCGSGWGGCGSPCWSWNHCASSFHGCNNGWNNNWHGRTVDWAVRGTGTVSGARGFAAAGTPVVRDGSRPLSSRPVSLRNSDATLRRTTTGATGNTPAIRADGVRSGGTLSGSGRGTAGVTPSGVTPSGVTRSGATPGGTTRTLAPTPRNLADTRRLGPSTPTSQPVRGKSFPIAKPVTTQTPAPNSDFKASLRRDTRPGAVSRPTGRGTPVPAPTGPGSRVSTPNTPNTPIPPSRTVTPGAGAPTGRPGINPRPPTNSPRGSISAPRVSMPSPQVAPSSRSSVAVPQTSVRTNMPSRSFSPGPSGGSPRMSTPAPRMSAPAVRSSAPTMRSSAPTMRSSAPAMRSAPSAGRSAPAVRSGGGGGGGRSSGGGGGRGGRW